ncbi:type VI secretion system-associated FHA domain protein TagH [Inquilinus sp. Marseille-Q2685]|uniref:type VI secretion system-associated FHA domain protein TagH n=1 Tax=Inquilinus sp. Marseille-Q2685 TaxID=2866581 RepID=UPI001CE487F4|nr:type VI secretion system-associated FHA domain protein TagH [Inquilinus sp. Marseille-Q2685]
MKLILDLTTGGSGLSGSDATRTLDRCGLTLGRGQDNDWVLEDGSRFVSKNHCLIDYVDGHYVLFDLSTNGTFVNGAATPVGRSGSVVLSDGDRIAVGDYHFLVRLSGADAPAASHSIDIDDPMALPFGVDTGSGPRLPPHRPEETGWPPLSAPSQRSPFEATSDDGWARPAEPDHIPAQHVAIRPPAPQFREIPEDWAEESPAPAARPAPVRPIPRDWHDTPAPPSPPAPPQPDPAPPPPEARPPAPAGADPLRPILEAAGLDPEQFPAERGEELARMIGQILRTSVRGLLEALDARSSLKTEFRIERTAIQPRNNNPLKFATTVEEALAAILSPPLPAFAKGADAVEEGFRDLRRHQIGTIGGMEAALRHLLDRLSPDAVAEAAGGASGGLGAVLPATRKARLWDAYVALHRQMSERASENVRDLFGKSFAEGYERLSDPVQK